MHETGIAVSILESAVRLVGTGSIEEVRVAVGELSSVEPELLEFAWEAVVSGTPHVGSKLSIEWRPARQYCKSCGEDKPRVDKGWHFLCPDCRQPMEVEGGYDLDLLQITYTDDAETERGSD